MQKTNYITNKELLKEIHQSKKSYCWFERPEYSDYDVIVSDLGEITPEVIADAVHAKANPKGKGAVPVIVQPDDLVFRLMTHAHIPLDPDRKRKARNTDKSYTRTNFPPFKHFVRREGEMVEVGRSHWKGDLATGEFCLDKGKMTNRLAYMLMMLVDRYGLRGQWRGYSYNDEMRGFALVQLSQVALYFDESKGDNPFAFYWTTMLNCFTRVLLVERRNQKIRDDMLIVAGVTPSYTRQIENEMEIRGAAPAGEGAKKAAPSKRKRGAPRRKVTIAEEV